MASTKKDREAINNRYTAACIAIGEYMVKHVLFKPEFDKMLRDVLQCAKDADRLDNPPTKGTNDQTK